jgi:hypothetical protein
MKNFLQSLISLFESMGKARAATYFTRQGDYEAARRIMLS